jgi:transcriptional regulator with PAS, ATPase and Fis domain
MVPFSEVVAAMNFLADSVNAVFPPLPISAPTADRWFEKLNHCRIIVLADSYFRSQTATARIDSQELDAQAAKLPPELRTRFYGIVGSSAAMRELYRRIEMAGQTRGTMLVVGDSGTGKELVARAIHACEQDRAASSSPFVALNCAALPKDLIESELFGYRRGAFSGADTEYLGLFRAADGGTLFLDEITEMTPDTQSKLLRAIQERRVRPVGAVAEIPVEVRLIASTNRDPEEAVKSGQLRHDLYYRLQVSVLRVPRLRDRIHDLMALTQHFITMFNEKTQRHAPVTGIEASAIDAMMKYSWPGNVRELSNAIEGAFTFGNSSTIRRADLPFAITGEDPLSPDSGISSNALATFAEVERDLISRALETTEGNRAQASKLLRISRKKLYAKIAKYSIP